MGENITLNMVKCQVVGLLTAVLPTLGLLAVLLQPPDGEALLAGGVGQAPEAPALPFTMSHLAPTERDKNTLLDLLACI